MMVWRFFYSAFTRWPTVWGWSLGAALLTYAVASVAADDAGGRNDSRYREEVRQEIWARELAVYAGRGNGDLQPYIDALAADYQAWPPFREAPAGAEGLQELAVRMRGKDQEELEMSFVDFSLNGDTAAIYYKTHRTRTADGDPADDFYEVIHVWVREAGQWRVFAGMARDTPIRGAP